MRRERLSSRLLAADVPLVSLVAPPGYGKTTLLAEWAELDPRPFAWVTLDRRHEDPVLLVSSIVAALSEVGEVPDILGSVSGPQPDLPGTVLPRLAEALARFERRFVLVLDDVGQVSGEGARAVLSALVSSVAPGSTVAMAGKRPPPLAMGRLRGHRNVFELRRRDLAMTDAESRDLLAGTGVDLGSAELGTVIDRTEGWPVAIYLAGLAIKEQGGVDQAVASFTGGDFVMAEYLRDEFLANMSEEERRFLTRASILDGLCGDLCDAVLERTGSADLLAKLSQSNALLIWLDRRGEWFRMHGLMADMLRSDLRRSSPGQEAILHARASDWFASHGDAERAIGHAIAAGEIQRAGELIWNAVPELVSRGRNATIEAWLDSFTSEQIASSVTLSLTAAHVAIGRGDGERAEYWLVTASAGLARRTGSDNARLEAGVVITRAMVGVDGVRQMGVDAAKGAELVSADSPWRAICCFTKGVSEHLTGSRDAAREDLREGVRLASVAVPSLQALCLAQLAFIAGEVDDWRTAELEISRADRQVQRSGLSEYGSMAVVFAMSAAVKAKLGRRDEARRSLRRSLSLLGQVNSLPPWYEAETRIILAFAYGHLEEPRPALELLEDAEPHLARCPDAFVLAARHEECVAFVREAGAGAVAEGHGLTPAESRVLGYLPTHLTVGQIAEALYVSSNTVKTQSRSIYRKLGVTSRTEAVARARAEGLLKQP